MIQFGSSKKINTEIQRRQQRTRRKKSQILSDDADDADGYSIKKRSQV